MPAEMMLKRHQVYRNSIMVDDGCVFLFSLDDIGMLRVLFFLRRCCVYMRTVVVLRAFGFVS